MIVMKYSMHCESDTLAAPPGQIIKINVNKDMLDFWIRQTDKRLRAVRRKILIVPTAVEFSSKIYLEHIDTILIPSARGLEPIAYHVFEEYAPVSDPPIQKKS